MKILQKILTIVVLPVLIAILVYANVNSIMTPVNFNKEKDARQAVAVQRLKDIRTLQVAFKSEKGHYAPTMDSLILFFNEGKIKVDMRIGSQDDSLAMVNTTNLKKKYAKITPVEMNAFTTKDAEAIAKIAKKYRMSAAEVAKYQTQKFVYSIETLIPVADTLFRSREDFVVDSLAFIPFSKGEKVQMETVIKQVSGVKVPLFEACMPWKSLLKGLDNQLRINLDAQCEDRGQYKGLKVGSIDIPNNNAGNWE